MPETAIVALTRGGCRLGVRLRKCLRDSALYVPAKFFQEMEAPSRTFPYEDLRLLVERLFAPGNRLVFIMAAGIVVRLVAPYLKSKREDPGVVVLDEEGRHAVSLLSGHWGGGNGLTTEVASLLGTRAVITTASDVQSIPAVESLAQEFDCMIEDPSQLKGVSSALVNGEDVILYGTDCRERLAELCSFTAHLKFCSKWEDLLRRPAAAYILLTNREEELHFDLLASKGVVCLLRPRNVLVGIGCRRGVTAEEVASAVFSGLREAHLSPLSVRELATIRIKENEEGLIEFAQRHDLPIRYYSLEELNAEEGPFPSEMVQALIGVKGVCEPAALLSAPGGRLILPKKKVGRVTMAVAEANFTS